MKDIVEYIHTDTCASLNWKKRKACYENETDEWNSKQEQAETSPMPVIGGLGSMPQRRPLGSTRIG